MAAAAHWNVPQRRETQRVQAGLSRARVEINYWAIASIVYSALVWAAIVAWLF